MSIKYKILLYFDFRSEGVFFEKRMLITFLCLSFKAFVFYGPKHFLHSNLAVMVMWLYNNYG